MVEYDSNMIKPVDGLQNITGLAPARRREERRRRQQLDDKTDEKDKELLEEYEDKKYPDALQDDWAENECESDKGRIDYQA